MRIEERGCSGLGLYLFRIHPWIPLNHNMHIKEVLDFDINHQEDRGDQLCVLQKKSIQIYILEEDRLKSIRVSHIRLVIYISTLVGVHTEFRYLYRQFVCPKRLHA
jgi:hypothetical protein